MGFNYTSVSIPACFASWSNMPVTLSSTLSHLCFTHFAVRGIYASSVISMRSPRPKLDRYGDKSLTFHCIMPRCCLCSATSRLL